MAGATGDAAKIDFEVDGVVFKVDRAAAADAAGATARAPRSRVALKFLDGAVAATTLTAVDVGVGKRGVLTPVAVVAPVDVAGVVVRRASLHNFNVLRDTLRGVAVGDAVLVERAGDVIPRIVPRRGASDVDWPAPAACPCCGGPVFVDEAAGRATCTNGLACDDQAAGRLAHFCARSAVDLSAGALGKKKLGQLVAAGVARSPADLFDLLDDAPAARATLAALDGWAAASAAKAVGALAATAAEPVPLAALVYALGPQRVGRATADRVAAVAGTWAALWAALDETDETESAAALRTALAEAKGVGPAALDGLLDLRRDPDDRDTAARLAGRLRVQDAAA